MAKLQKTILSNKYSNELLVKEFSKLAKTSPPVDSSKVKEIYHDVFYNMKKKGKQSHTDIIEQSYNHINQRQNKKLDNEIKKLTEKLTTKESELTFLENPASLDHPIYEDKSILIAGENNQQYQDMPTKYVMQEGRKRAFGNDDIFKTTKKAMGLPTDEFDGRYFVLVDDLNKIPDGPPISTTSDLHLKGNDLQVDLPDIMGISAYVDVEFECLGNEVSDYVGAITPDTHHSSQDTMLDLNINTLQFYLNNEACTIKSIKDDYMNDDTGPTIITTEIPKGEKRTIRILRPSEFLNNMIPSDISDNPNYGYQNNIPNNIVYNGNDIQGYERLWGPGTDYPSVVHASGRIMSQEIENAHVNALALRFGETQNTNPRLFNGLPTSTTGVWGESDIQLITDPNYTGQEKSDYGTKMIYNKPGFFGNLNQSSDLQSKVFDNPSSKYYKPEFYGQPILKKSGKYCVIRKAYMGGMWTRKAIFVDVETGNEFKKTRVDIRDSMGFEMDYNVDPYDMKWHTLNKDRVKYIGLQEIKTKLQPIDDNFFNPVNGSNYEINQYNAI